MLRLFDCVRRLCPRIEKNDDIIDSSVSLESAVNALKDCIINLEITLESLGFISAIPRRKEIDYTTERLNKINQKYDLERRSLAFTSNVVLNGAIPYDSTIINTKEKHHREKFITSTRYIHSGRLPDKTLIAKKEIYHSEEEFKELTNHITNLFVIKTKIAGLIRQAEENEYLPHQKLTFADEFIKTLKGNEAFVECVDAWGKILSDVRAGNYEAENPEGIRRRLG